MKFDLIEKDGTVYAKIKPSPAIAQNSKLIESVVKDPNATFAVNLETGFFTIIRKNPKTGRVIERKREPIEYKDNWMYYSCNTPALNFKVDTTNDFTFTLFLDSLEARDKLNKNYCVYTRYKKVYRKYYENYSEFEKVLIGMFEKIKQ